MAEREREDNVSDWWKATQGKEKRSIDTSVKPIFLFLKLCSECCEVKWTLEVSNTRRTSDTTYSDKK